MKKIRTSIAALMVGASAMLMSSCLGSFGLTRNVYEWNKTVTNNKWINEIIFAVLSPFYMLPVIVDVFVLNSIEFWTGNSPMASIDTTIKGENGEYHVKSTENGYHIELLGSGFSADFVFDKESQTWSLEENGKSIKLVQFVDNNAKFYFGDQELVANMESTRRLLSQQ